MMADDLQRLLSNYADSLDAQTIHAPALGLDGDEPAAGPPITVKQHAAYLPMSLEVAMDTGLLTEEEARARGWTPTPPVKVSRWRRARWRWQSWRERAGRKIGGWIAGVDLSDRDDW